jgi:hypothetical protein
MMAKPKNKEEWYDLFKEMCSEVQKKNPHWPIDKIKMLVKRNMPEFPQNKEEKYDEY